MSDEFFTDVTTLRARARQHIERGAVTKGYQGQLDVVLRLLNEALATDRRFRLHDTHHARGNPGHGGRARRRHGEPPDDARPEGPGPGERTDVHVEREGILLNHAARCSRTLTPIAGAETDSRLHEAE